MNNKLQTSICEEYGIKYPVFGWFNEVKSVDEVMQGLVSEAEKTLGS